MSAEPKIGQDEEGLETERLATSMQDQLSKEVASWSKERRHQSSETVVAPSQPVAQRRSPRPAGETRKSAAAPPLAGKPAGTGSRPFRMAYGGMMQAEYIQYMLDRGSR
jgi:hypothetical protein